MSRCLFISVLLWSLCANLYGQDPSFSQIENTQSYSHPSLYSLRQGLQIDLAHRLEWNNLYGDFQTTYFAAFFQKERVNFGYGVSLLQDIEGDGKLKTQSLNFHFRKAISWGYQEKNKIIFSLSLGVTRRSIDWSKLVFSDQIDPVWGIYKESDQSVPSERSTVSPNFGVGITGKGRYSLFKRKHPFSVSIDLKHLNQIVREDESLLGLEKIAPTLVVATISTTVQPIEFYGLPLLKPMVRIESQNRLKKIEYGSLVGLVSESQSVYAGLFYSQQISPLNYFNTNSLILLLGCEKKYEKALFAFGYSYDIPVSGMGIRHTYGTHEITVNIIFSGSKKFVPPSHSFDQCPKS